MQKGRFEIGVHYNFCYYRCFTFLHAVRLYCKTCVHIKSVVCWIAVKIDEKFEI